MAGQDHLLGYQQHCVGEMDECNNQLTNAVAQAILSCPVLVMTSYALVEGFLLHCFLYFASQVGTTDQHKFVQFPNILTGKVLKWAITLWEKEAYDQFIA